MDLRREQEALYVAMALGRDVVDTLIEEAPPALESDFKEVREALAHVIRLLERNIDPRDISIIEG